MLVGQQYTVLTTDRTALTSTLWVTYKIWGVIQQRVYQSRVHDVGELKQRLLDIWHDIEHSIIDSAIDEWRVRLEACVQSRGGHFEQML